MKISSHFLVYLWLSCLTLIVAVVIKLSEVGDDEKFKFIRSLIFPSVDTENNPVTADTFDQRLDHYNRTEYNRVFKQNYLFNKEYYDTKDNAPVVLLVVSAMTEIKDEILQDETYVEFAKKSNALMIAVEPRFYGTSQPFTDLSVDHLYFLNTEQSLADLALFRDKIPAIMKKKYDIDIPENAKWVATGKEFGGSLAAWYRLKYPHKAMAAVPLSAPLWVKPNFEEHFDRMEIALEMLQYDAVIIEALASIMKFLRENDEKGIKLPWNERKAHMDLLQNDFKLCAKLYSGGGDDETDEENQTGLEGDKRLKPGNKGGVKEGTLLINNKNMFLFTLALNLSVITKESQDDEFKTAMDQYFTDENATSYDKLKNAIQYTLKLTAANGCLENNYNENIGRYQKTSLEEVNKIPDIIKNVMGIRTELFQKCFEFGMFKCAGVDNYYSKLIPVTFYTDWCVKVFNPGMTHKGIESAIFTTNLFYGSLRYEGRKTLFINNKGDAFAPSEIKESKKANEVVSIVITDLPEDYDSSSEIEKARIRSYFVRIFKPLLKWVGGTEAVSNASDIPLDEYRDETKQKENSDAIIKAARMAERQKAEEEERKAAAEAALRQNQQKTTGLNENSATTSTHASADEEKANEAVKSADTRNERAESSNNNNDHEDGGNSSSTQGQNTTTDGHDGKGGEDE